MEILLMAVLVVLCLLITWVLVIKNGLLKENKPIFYGLIIFMGVINGAIFAGLITLINLMQYHY